MFEIVYWLDIDIDGEVVFGCSEIKLCELCGFAVKNIEGHPVKRPLKRKTPMHTTSANNPGLESPGYKTTIGNYLVHTESRIVNCLNHKLFKTIRGIRCLNLIQTFS